MEKLLERERELAAVEVLLERGGILVVEGRAGIGKTSLVEVACRRAEERGHETLRARGSELEADFAFGVVRQLFERRLADASADEREALLVGPAAAVRPLLLGQLGEASAYDTSFAVLHGLYWLAANLAARRPLLLAVDDAHWADEPSLRWLAYLAARLEGLALALLVALRPAAPTAMGASLLALCTEAQTVVRPALLSEGAASAIVRATLGDTASEALCAAAWAASGGNPLYLAELLRAVGLDERPLAELQPAELLVGGREGIARRVVARVRDLDPRALGLAQVLAVLGDGCELRHAAAIAGVEMADATRLAAGLVRLEVLAADDPPRFIHPVVRDALEASLASDERDAAHRSAARLLHAAGAPAGQVAAHLVGARPAGDRWVLARLQEAAQAAMASGAPQVAAGLLDRALAEPPSPDQRVGVLREVARAEASAGREAACVRLEEALRLAADPRERAEIALEVAEAYAALFRWVEAVDVIERAPAELGESDAALAARLEGELVVCGLHDARRAARPWRGPRPLRQLLAEVGLKRYRDDDDQPVDDLCPEAGQPNGDDASVDRADDERGHERPENTPAPAEDGCAAQEHRGQRVQQVAVAERGPEVQHLQAHHHPGERRRQPHRRERDELHPVRVDPHQPGALRVVAHQVHVGAEPVPIQHEPDERGDRDSPEHLHRDDPADAPHQRGVQQRPFRRRQAAPVAAGDDQHHPAPEELRPDRRHQRGNPDADDDDPVQPAGKRSGQQRGEEGEREAPGRRHHRGEGDHAERHDGGERQVDLARHHQQRQRQRHQGEERGGGHERLVDLPRQERARRADQEDEPDDERDDDDADLQRIAPGEDSSRRLASAWGKGAWLAPGNQAHRSLAPCGLASISPDFPSPRRGAASPAARPARSLRAGTGPPPGRGPGSPPGPPPGRRGRCCGR